MRMFTGNQCRPLWRRVTLALAALALSVCWEALADEHVPHVIEIRMMMSKDGTQPYFDPVGIHIQPGDTVRWVQISNYHSVAAYHPKNGNHELRIPEQAKPWNSTVLLAEYPARGSTFEYRFTVEGVYDYFCQPHEAAGMVGRIVVGAPGDGPGTRPFGYAPEKAWNAVPLVAQKQFPAIREIMREGSVRVPWHE
jgi:plastocyanin